jgi:hypothetical protein
MGPDLVRPYDRFVLHPETILELVRQRQAELAREAEHRRLARSAAWMTRTFRRLVAGSAMHRDDDARISRSTGGRT